MHNEVKSEQHFVVTSDKRVDVLHVNLKIVREEAGAQFSYKDNKYSTSQCSKYLHEGGTLNN